MSYAALRIKPCSLRNEGTEVSRLTRAGFVGGPNS